MGALSGRQTAWNQGVIVGQKRPLKVHHVWVIRTRLEISGETRNLALFNMAIDSKLPGTDLVTLKVRDVSSKDSIGTRANIIQQKNAKPVQFEITEVTRKSIAS